MSLTHLVFVGQNKTILIDSIKEAQIYPVKKVILIINQQKKGIENKSKILANEIKNSLAPFFDIEIIKMDKMDAMKGANEIIDIIIREKKCGNDVLIDLSCFPRSFLISGFIAGCVTQSKMVTTVLKFRENDEETSIEKIIEIPKLPLNYLSKAQFRVLQAIDNKEMPLEDLIYKLFPEIEDEIRETAKRWPQNNPDPLSDESLSNYLRYLKSKSTERSKLLYHLNKFEEIGFINREKRGKQVILHLTELGRIFRRQLNTD